MVNAVSIVDSSAPEDERKEFRGPGGESTAH
jgi:hypothetical protein